MDDTHDDTSMESASPIEDVLSSDTEEIEAPTRSTQEIEAPTRSRSLRFSAAQVSYLNMYYNGMTGVAKRFSLLIQQAAKETQLTSNQIKVNCSTIIYPRRQV